MRMLLHKGRHIVVADLPETTDTLAADTTIDVVARVGIAAGVEGVHRRGRPPVYSKPVPTAELELLDHATLDQTILDAGAAALAPVPVVDEPSAE